eukprot:GEMP01029363.1.p1 GENE.GEMP01029363.1~~GEMP01029363.1.p1  ORF type:complete len:453 (+),score=99.35 GEMP01029363.1:47-1405(+)
MAEMTTYDRMLLDGKLRDPNPAFKPAGKSAPRMGEDSTHRDVCPEIFYPQPPTPPNMRKYRVNYIPGEIMTHWGLKEQKLPNEEFAYGIETDKGESVEQIFVKAAETTQGMAEYKNNTKEAIYASSKREPLGRSYERGHVLPAEVYAPEFLGFGVHVNVPPDLAKNALYPRNAEPDNEEIRKRYVWTHGTYAPGEMVNREYNWPEATKDNSFRFGITDRAEGGREGDGTKAALDMEIEDDGTYPRTVIVGKNVDDFRWRDHDQLGKTKNMVYEHPPVPVNHAYGKASGKRESTAEICVKGEYTKEQQQPDPDLGKCIKIGQRNFTDGPRAYGTPSVRSDIPAPAPEKRGLADVQNYGDEAGTGPLLNPGRFESMGISKDVFLLRREKAELRSILKCAGYEYDDDRYESLWTRARALFEDELDMASIDSLLYITRQGIGENVAQELGALNKMD